MNSDFHGNAVFANMCSKCYKESEKELKQKQNEGKEKNFFSLQSFLTPNKIVCGHSRSMDCAVAMASPTASEAAPATTKENALGEKKSTDAAALLSAATAATAATAAAADADAEMETEKATVTTEDTLEEEPKKIERPKQTDMGRCFVCRAKVPRCFPLALSFVSAHESHQIFLKKKYGRWRF